LIPPRDRWPPDQLAGAEGQGHPQLLWAAVARSGVVFSPLFTQRWVSCWRTECQRQGAGEKRTAAAQHFWRTASRVTPSWTAGGRETGSPYGCQAVRTVEDRVTASVAVSKATGHRRRRTQVRVTPKWTAGGPLPGSHFLSTASLRSHHLPDTGQRLRQPGGPPWRLQGGP
jgi:hypothetical protein